jgi:hypothetical protein
LPDSNSRVRGIYSGPDTALRFVAVLVAVLVTLAILSVVTA